jgi:hypothetical protein
MKKKQMQKQEALYTGRQEKSAWQTSLEKSFFKLSAGKNAIKMGNFGGC